MVNGPKNTALTSSGLNHRGGVNSLAVQALSVLKAKGGAIAPDYKSPQLEAICDAFVAPDEAERHEAISALQSHGLSNTDIIEHIIPTTAQLLGDRWFANDLSFADVTIGAARLQETIRALNAKVSRDQVLNGDSILLVVPRNEHHTLGVFVAAHKFRTLGVDVQLAVGMHPAQVAKMVKKYRFPAVGITSSGRRSLSAARELVDAVRKAVPKITPIVIGGGVTNLPLDIKQITGADHVSSDPETVIDLCGLETSYNLEAQNV